MTMTGCTVNGNTASLGGGIYVQDVNKQANGEITVVATLSNCTVSSNTALGKYGGGVFCNLPDGVVCMCNYSYQHEDADFMVGEHVMLIVQRYENEKLQMYGKIMNKW